MQNYIFNNAISVSFREDGFLNATAIASHFGKVAKDYLKTEQTQQYIIALAEFLSKGNKIPLEENQIVSVKKGGNDSGTWLHPKLAIHFARWLDAKFAVWCDMKIEEILGINQASQYLSEWEQEQIRVAVKNRSIKTGETTQAIYVKLHSFMRVARYEQISQADFQTALNYLASIQNAPEIVKPVEQQEPNYLRPLLQHTMYLAQFVLRYHSALHVFNRELASGLYSHAEHAYIAVRSVADGIKESVPSNKYWEYYPFDGDVQQKRRYRELNLA